MIHWPRPMVSNSMLANHLYLVLHVYLACVRTKPMPTSRDMEMHDLRSRSHSNYRQESSNVLPTLN